jgi:uncharacterized protein YjbI with pentapeptide repeats
VSDGSKGAALLTVVAIILLAAIYGSAVLVSNWLAPELTGAELDAAGIDDATERLAQQEARRQRRDELFGTALNGGLQLVAGLALGVGAVATWRTLRLTQRKGETDRFAKAAELLGHERSSARASGVYALGRMVADNEADRATIVDLLCAYVREHSSQEPPNDSNRMLAVRAPDVQAAVTVLGQISSEEAPVSLPFVNLVGVDLAGANLTGAYLAAANLAAADLTRANLADAYLTAADLTDARLKGACLTDANLAGTRLTRAVLSDADLTRADLYEADLTRADLIDANLSSAGLTGAKLIHANLARANLTGADLTAASLTGAKLAAANLTGADLTYARFADASLTRANLTHANLTHANLTRADFTDADLTDADLTDARSKLGEPTWPAGFNPASAGYVSTDKPG